MGPTPTTAGLSTRNDEPRDTARFVFVFETPPVERRPTVDGVHIRLDDFHTFERREGAPDVPTRTVLVAIPPDAEPRLVVRPGPETFVGGVRPRPVPRVRAVPGEPDRGVLVDESLPLDDAERSIGRLREVAEYVEDPDRYAASAAPFPERVAWLGEIGVLRDQRYVQVHLAPVRFDPARGGLAVHRSLEVEVLFEGGETRRTPPATEPRFEPVYRKAFRNYEQGRTFRLSELAPLEPGVSRGTGEAGFDGTTPLRRIRIRDNGAVRLDHATMSATAFATEPLSTWKLTNRGVEVPLQVMDDDRDGTVEPTDGNDLLDPGEWVQFYGEALDDEPKTVLNTDLFGPVDLYEVRDFTDENVYFLTVEAGARTRMTERDATPPHTLTPPNDFEALARAEVDNAFRPYGGADPWYWLPTLIGPDQREDVVPLPGLASTTAPLDVSARLTGRSDDLAVDPDHTTRITLLNSASQQLQVDTQSWEGFNQFQHDFSWSFGGGNAASDPVRVRTEALAPGAAARNDAILDFIEVRYRRLFQTSGDVLTFDYPDGNAEFVVSGLASNRPEVYEITGTVGGSEVVDAVRLTGLEVTGLGPFSVRFRMDDQLTGANRTFVVVGDGAPSMPGGSDFTTDTVSNLRDTTNEADLIVITHPDLLDDPVGCTSTALTDLLNYRAATQGLTSRVVCMEDVEDEFNDGLPGPLAIRNFITFVLSTQAGEGWTGPGGTSDRPSFVLLLGDASYDYKAGTAQGNFVPTQIMTKESSILGYYTSDNLLAATVGGDQLADLMIGRLSARTLAEADTMLQKVLDYEQSSAPGNWYGHSLLVADRGKGYDDFEASEFERINEIGENAQTIPPHSVRKIEFWSGTDYCDKTPANCMPAAPVANQHIKQTVNGTAGDGKDGVAMIQFTGHGNFELWSDDIIFCGVGGTGNCPTNDTSSLINGLRLPWLVVHNCLTGGFHTTAAESFGESWVKRSGGGAVAVYAPSGLGFRFIGEPVTRSIWEDVYGKTKQRSIGGVVLTSLALLCGQDSIEACQYYVLQGDPASILQIPKPDAPSGLGATPGNAVVDLSWTASSSHTGHQVYRSAVPQAGYVKVNASPVTCPLGGACSYSDTSAENAKKYYYYVVAADADGFESVWSNFNEDCDDGPGCVHATPLNPNPPVPPTGLSVLDPEIGFRLNLDWADNAENDIDFYTVHWRKGNPGTPGVYTDTQKAGRDSQTVVGGLENGEEYFFAVTATNTSGLTSGFSTPEASGIPTLVLGEKAPALITDLQVDKSGSDALLSWSAVTEDIYGKPETVDFYEVFRGTTPTFVPSLANRIGTVTAPTTSFSDTNALLATGADYHYLVRAVDVDGNAGGTGRQLPDGIGDLMVTRAGNCSVTSAQTCTLDADCPTTETCVLSAVDLELSWSAVTTDFDGGPTTVEHYELYGADAPFTRADIRDGLVPLLASPPGTSIRITPPAQDRYYTVLAVDAKDNKSPF